jgi:hypothetical protein
MAMTQDDLKRIEERIETAPSREDIRRLLAEVRRLRKELDDAERKSGNPDRNSPSG